MFGALFAVYAINVPGPSGPKMAVMQCRVVLLVLLDSLLKRTVPSYMQLIGLVVGIFGTLILSIPDKMLDLVCCRCKKKPTKKEIN